MGLLHAKSDAWATSLSLALTATLSTYGMSANAGPTIVAGLGQIKTISGNNHNSTFSVDQGTLNIARNTVIGTSDIAGSVNNGGTLTVGAGAVLTGRLNVANSSQAQIGENGAAATNMDSAIHVRDSQIALENVKNIVSSPLAYDGTSWESFESSVRIENSSYSAPNTGTGLFWSNSDNVNTRPTVSLNINNSEVSALSDGVVFSAHGSNAAVTRATITRSLASGGTTGMQVLEGGVVSLSLSTVKSTGAVPFSLPEAARTPGARAGRDAAAPGRSGRAGSSRR